MNRYKKLASNTAVFAIGTFLSKLLSYLLIFLYTRILTRTEISDAEMLQLVSNLIMPVAAVGVCDALMRFTIDAGDRRKEVFSSSIAILLGGTVGFLLLSPVLLLFDALGKYVWLIVLFVVCANLQMAVSFYVRSMGYTRLYAVQGIMNTLLTILFNLLLLFVLKLGVTGFILSITLANFVVTVFLFVIMKMWRDISAQDVRRSTVKALLLYGIPMIPTTILWTLTNLSDHLIVRTFVDGGSEERVNDGLFVCSYKIPNVLTLITTVFIEAWQLSAVNDAKDGEDRAEFFERVFSGYSSVIFMAASVLTALAKHLLVVLADPKFFDAWSFIPSLMVATVFSAFSTFISSVYSVKKKSLPAFLTALAGALINISVSLLLVGSLGVQGVAVGTLVSYLSLFVIRSVIAGRYVKFNLHVPKLSVNAVILSVQAVFMILAFPKGDLLSVPVWFLVQCAFVLIVVLVNLRSILSGIRLVLGRFIRRGKSAE